jgi:hypothetical protein
MRHFSSTVKIALAVLLLTGTSGFASDKDLPVVEGKKTVATINGEPITLEEFNQELSMMSEGTEGSEKVAKEKRTELLKRLINTRLIIQEARRMGLDEIPELKKRIEVFSRVTLREALMERQAKNIKPDAKEVERIYKESVKEWRIQSIVFEKEEDAKKMEQAIKEGKDFDETLRKFLADRKGKGDAEAKYLKGKDLLPEISEAVSKMKVGSISPVLRIPSGFVILKIGDVRFPENPEARAKAKQEVLRKTQREALARYEKTLREKYVKVNQDVLKGLDFESKEPGFEKLLKDKRVVAEIKGEKPITVGEMTEYLRQQLYHGVERAVESKRLNQKKDQILEEMIYKRVFQKEALRVGIDKTEGYKNRVKEYEHSLVFGAFIQKAVAPDVKLKEEELKAYYDQQIKDYTYPEMMRMSTLVFERREAAEKAILALRKGTEFQWVKASAEGQMDRNTRKILDLDGKPLITRDLPEELRKAIAGAKTGDFRLYQSPENYFYVISIQQVVPSKPQPYEEVREKVARKVYDDKLKRAVEDYADKLRAVSDVKIYLQE